MAGCEIWLFFVVILKKRGAESGNFDNQPRSQGSLSEYERTLGTRLFDYERERDFLFLLGWDAGIVREK